MAKRKKNKKNKKSRAVAAGAARAAGMASTTFGRARRFKDRKREEDRKACRKPVDY